MPLPDTWSELYPNRFIHADLLKGRKVTLTIKNLDIEEMETHKGKKGAVIAYFHERPLQLGTNKTNGYCLKRMFGNNPHDWIGKRITIYPTTTSFGKEKVDCIRIWGSPDLQSDMAITVPQGRKKPIEMTMHKVKPGECGFKGDSAPVATPTPEVAENMDQNPRTTHNPQLRSIGEERHER